MAKYDLTKLHCQFLDRHLTFPLFEFLCEKQLYNPNEILKCILDTVNKTNMIDYIMDTRKRLGFNGDMPKELVKRKRAVLDTLKSLKNELSPIMNAMEILKDGENIKDIKSFIKILENEHNFNMDHLDCCYSLAKYLYECGNYQESISYLYFCSIVMSPDHKNYLNVLWGKLAAEILLLNWNTALDDLMRLRDYIDASNFNDLQFLQQRTWLIHWSVLIFFNHSRGRELFIDMFLYEPYYINAIQTMCPHILRYLATAVIVESDRRDALKDLIRIIKQESYAYRDPITEFIECLYVNFDFEMARFKLHECQTLILSDFFIEDCLNKFIENARLMLFEAFCRTHQCVSIKMMAEKLNMEPQAAECWIVKLIQSARLNATIDSKLGHVVMCVQRLSPYQQLADKLESLTQRSEQLTKLVERCSEQKKPNAGESWKYYPSQ